MLAQETEASHANTALGLVVILITAAVVATLFRKLRLQIIPGYIIAGTLVSGLVIAFKHFYPIDLGAVDTISDFATVLLMFTIGLQLDFDSLKRSMVSILGIGVTSTIACALALFGASKLFGLSAPAAFAVGMAMSISSTAVLLRVLQERRELHQVHGRLCIGASIAQDLLSIVMLGLMPAIAAWNAASGKGGGALDSMNFGRMLSSALLGLGGIAVLLLIGRYALPRVLDLVADVGARGQGGRTAFGSRELVLVTSTAIALAAAIATQALGFSHELGAFMAGLVLAFTPYRAQLAGQFEPLRDLLMAIFFTSVGLTIRLGELGEFAAPILLGVVALMAIKILITSLSAWSMGSSAPLAIVTGIYLGNAGEFSLVLLAAASQTGPVPILDRATLGALIAVVVLSLILSPFAFSRAHALAKRFERIGPPFWSRPLAGVVKADQHAAEPGVPSDAARTKHVIIAGFGPVGRNLGARLDVQKVPYTVIELNAETVRKQRGLGRSIMYGDVTNPEVLEAAGVQHADAVIITIPDDEATLRAVSLARSIAPGTFIACRMSFLSGAFRSYQAGADHAVVEEVVTADAMEKQIFEKLRERRTPAQPLAGPEDGAQPSG